MFVLRSSYCCWCHCAVDAAAADGDAVGVPAFLKPFFSQHTLHTHIHARHAQDGSKMSMQFVLTTVFHRELCDSWSYQKRGGYKKCVDRFLRSFSRRVSNESRGYFGQGIIDYSFTSFFMLHPVCRVVVDGGCVPTPYVLNILNQVSLHSIGK